MSSASEGLAQGLQRVIVTQGLAAGIDKFERKSGYNGLSPSGRTSGMSAAQESHVQFRPCSSVRALLPVPFRSRYRMVAEVL